MTVRDLTAIVSSSRLDRRLAAGADPQSSAALAARAARVTDERFRARVADGLAAAIDRASNERSAFSAAIPVQWAQVQNARAELTELIDELRAPWPVRPQGVAMARRLLLDGGGPLYAPAPSGTLRSAAWTALDRLSDGP